jgi:thermostable 8-oxoguanine DNA glycosylase
MTETQIRNVLVASKIGQYGRLTKAVMDSLNLDLRTCTLEDLLAVHGVGPKTARFFLLHSRRYAKHAVLDTHILSWLRSHGVENAPKATPQNPKLYAELEDTFIRLAELWFPNVPLAEVDLLIWMQQSGRLSDEVFV